MSSDSTVKYDELERRLQAVPFGIAVYQMIVDAPFANELDAALLFLGFICFYLVDPATNKVKLLAASDTEHYRKAIHRYKFKTSDYQLDFVKNKNNPVVKAIMLGEIQINDNWAALSREHSSDQAAQVNQSNSGIAYTEIHPLPAPLRGALMYNYYQFPDQISAKQDDFMRHYTALVAKYLYK